MTCEAPEMLLVYLLQICRTFAHTGTCPYGSRCRFIHYFQRPANNAGGNGLLRSNSLAAGIPGMQTNGQAGCIDGLLPPATLNGNGLPNSPRLDLSSFFAGQVCPPSKTLTEHSTHA